jgi:hypothetical protein
VCKKAYLESHSSSTESKIFIFKILSTREFKNTRIPWGKSTWQFEMRWTKNRNRATFWKQEQWGPYFMLQPSGPALKFQLTQLDSICSGALRHHRQIVSSIHLLPHNKLYAKHKLKPQISSWKHACTQTCTSKQMWGETREGRGRTACNSTTGPITERCMINSSST